MPPTATDAFVTDRCATGQRLEYWTFARLDHGTIVQPGTSLDERLAVWTAARTRRRQAAARASPSDVAGHPLSQTAQLPPLITLEVKSGFAWLYDKYIDQVDENTEANYWNAQEQERGDTQTGAADTRLIQDYLGHKNITHTVRYTKLAPGRFTGLF